jgi:hypothetical protein
VDVCGASDPASAFQGRSLDVSGRGMQVRAAHLPELRAPIVIRFQEQGSEVIAEGEVAWRRACASGGEFGVRFTALDSRSVQALKALCGSSGLDDLEPSSSEPAALARRGGPLDASRGEIDHDTDPAPPAALGVRLHIAGLSAPLHAQIKGQGARSLELGSQLEFLRVGRQLEIEDLAYGARRPAFVESVEVNVDQKSRVPELLVSVRYSEPVDLARTVARPRLQEPQRARMPLPDTQRSRTPEPQRAGTPAPQRVNGAEPARARTPEPARARTPEPARARTPQPVAARSVETRGPIADRVPAGRALPSTSPRAPSVRARELEPELDLSTAREVADDESAEERDSTPPPLPMRADRAEPPSSRPEREAAARVKDRDPEDDPEGAVADSAEALLRRLEGLLGNASSAARAAGTQVVRLGGAASRGAGWLLARTRQAMHAPRRPATPRRRTTAAPRSVRSSPLRQNPQLSVQRARSEEASAAARASGSRLILWSGLIAIVAISIGYLARRGPMTLPAAPPASRVAAAPAAAPTAGVELSRAAPAEPAASAAPASGVSALRAAPSSADDDTSSADSSDSSARSSEGTPGSSRGSGGNPSTDEFGQGRLHLPVIYRLRMDDAGGTLRGERTPTGFEITIPGRRMLDSGASITRRDPRIAKVTTHNSAQGARVSFRFRETIPAYKVRIRKDIVEFWISAN